MFTSLSYVLHALQNLKQLVPEDLSYIVERNMVFAEKPFNPESSTMGLNLLVKGQQWEPPMSDESWKNGQFTLVIHNMKLYVPHTVFQMDGDY